MALARMSAQASPKPRKTVSRYDLSGAREPPNGRANPPRSLNARTAVVAVPDPLGRDAHDRHLATVNRRVDILEWERSHGRLSDAAYGVGRIAQAVFERYRGVGSGSQWRMGDRVDAAVAHELAIVYAIDNARDTLAFVDKIRRTCGRIDANIIQRILGEGKTYSEVATLVGKDGERGASYIAQRFRDALDVLAEEFAARGRTKNCA